MALSVSAKISLISNLCNDFADYTEKYKNIPQTKSYKIIYSEDRNIKQAARNAAFNGFFTSPLIKLAFDTRRVDQENDRNPRQNLQYWHRSDPFIDDEDKKKLNIFAKLQKVLDNLKNKLGTSPDWFESYARQLYDNSYRILRVKQADLDIFRPSLAYLEQLIYARYRLTMENIEKISEEDLENKILSKDEGLIGRAAYLSDIKTGNSSPEIIKDSLVKPTQESIVNAIFGGERMVRAGERAVERTITITIRDNVID